LTCGWYLPGSRVDIEASQTLSGDEVLGTSIRYSIIQTLPDDIKKLAVILDQARISRDEED
jgi:hypothetical protein